MTTEYQMVQELAKEEAAYLKAQSCYDLKHRSRYIPPINWILYIIIFIIHIINFLPALLLPNYLNIYAHCYRHWHHPHDRPEQYKKYEKIQKLQFEIWDESQKNIMNTRLKVLDYYWKSLFAAWAAKPCCKNINILDWKIYHVNCYNIVSNGTNNIQKWNVVDINEYFNVYEHCTQNTLDQHDKNLVAHLTSNSCVFCKYCKRSITTSPNHIKSQLLTPFWVLADIISIWCFLVILYFPISILLFIIGVAERIIYGSINEHHLLYTSHYDDDDNNLYNDDEATIQYLAKKISIQNTHHPNMKENQSKNTLETNVFNMLNARKRRKLRDYGKQYYRKTATNFNYLGEGF